MPYKLKTAVAVTVISLFLIAEVVRKYIYSSNNVLLAADLCALLIAAVLLPKVQRRATPILLVAMLIIVWKLFSVILGHQNLMLGLIGIRSLLVPVAFFIFGLALFREFGVIRATQLIYRTFTFWLAIIGFVMIAQLVVGRDHWLNALPVNLGDEAGGIGDYTSGEMYLDYLFRPTSIFLHTGKLGQVVFVLAAYRLFYMFAKGTTVGWLGLNIVIDSIVILLTGQRMAMLAYFLALVVSSVMLIRKPVMALFLGCAVILFAAVDNQGGGDETTFVGMIGSRFVSGWSDIQLRIAENIIAPANRVFDQYGLVPAGAGAFSLGAREFGGQPLYEIIAYGTAENSWLRLLAEEGVIGLLLGNVFWMWLFSYGIVSILERKSILGYSEKLVTGMSLSALFVLGIVLLWANTHDVLGNATMMSLIMVMIGAFWARHWQKHSLPSMTTPSK